MKVTVLTPTADRPVGLAMCETMMRRQTVQPTEWIVADGGQAPAGYALGQIHVHEPRPPGASNFASNLLNGLARATGELVVIVEDDDAYLPTHIESLVALVEKGYRLIGSEEVQRYYNVAHRCFRMMNNIGASLCQTAVHRSLLPAFRTAIQSCLGRNAIGVDATLWRAIPRTQWAFTNRMTVVGIKGLPGRVGLGIGHRPDARWTPDPELVQLRAWLGEDAERYAPFRMPRAA